MNEQLLRDFVATAEYHNYDWETIFSKFPELQGYDQQVLKDYAATAKYNNYDFGITNSKFPEFNQAPQQEEPGMIQSAITYVKGLFSDDKEEDATALKKKEEQGSTELPSEESLSASPSSPETVTQINAQVNTQPKTPNFFADLLNSITPELIDEDEDDIEDKLGKKLSPYGVKVEQDKRFREAIKLSVGEEGEPGYKEISVPVDNFFGDNDKKSAIDLKKWLLENTNKEKINEQQLVSEEFQKATLNEQGFNKGLGGINADLISKDAESIVPQLTAMFGGYGIGDNKFKFEEVGITDNIKVTAPNGKVFVTEVDAMTEAGDLKIAADLKRFMEENKPALLKAEDNLNKYATTFLSEKEMEEATKSFSLESENFKNDVNSALLEKKALEKGRGKMSPEEYNQRTQALNEKIKSISEKEGQLNANKLMLDKSLANYVEWRSEQGGVVGSIWNSLIGGYGSQSSGITGFFGDIALSIAPADVMIKDYKRKFLEEAIQNGIDVPSLKMSESDFDKWTETLPENVKNSIESKVVDNAKKEFKKEVAFPSGKALVKKLGVSEVTPEYMEKAQKTTVLQSGAMGVAGSLPAIAGSIAGPGGGKLTVAQFALQGYDATMQEMSGEKFEDIPENEKYLVAVPVAILNGVLEEYGFRNMIGKSGVTTSILSSVMGKAGKKATASTFKELVENEVESRVARGLLTLGAAGLSEAETGATQQLGELGIKEIYNQAREKELFQTPNGVSGWLDEIGESAKQEAIGGMIMGSIGAVSTAATDNNYNGVSDETLQKIEALRDDETIRKAYVANLKYEIASGNKTKEQAQAELDGYNKSISIYNQIPTDLSNAAKRKAFGLLKEKSVLEASVQGKDPSLVKKQNERINEIKNELSKLPELRDEGVQEASYSINGEQMSEQDFTNAISEMSDEDIKTADIKATNATEGVTSLLQDVARRSGVDSAPMMETTAPQEKAELSSNKKMGELSTELQNEIDDSGLISQGPIGDMAENKSVGEAIDNKIEYHQLVLERENAQQNPDANVVNENTEAISKLNDLKAKVEQENLAPTADEVAAAETVAKAKAKAAEKNKTTKKTKTLDEYSDELKSNFQDLLSNEEGDLKSEEEYKLPFFLKPFGKLANGIERILPASMNIEKYYKQKAEQIKNNPEQFINDEIAEYEKIKEKEGEDFKDQGYLDYLKEQQSKLQQENAIQEPTTEEGVLRTEQSQVGLPTVGQGNTQQATTEEGVATQKQEEVKPIEQELSELEQMFPTEGKKGESKGVSMSDKSQISDLEKRTTNENRKRIIKTAAKALNTLKSIFPDMDIVLHDNQDSYNAQMAIINNPYNSAGTFTYIKDKNGNVIAGRIDINLDKANMRTVAHEVAHAIMLKSFGDNVALFKNFRGAISKILSDSTLKQFDDFASNYSETESHEEFLVELAAVLSENEEKIPINTTQKIAELINKVVSKITGGKLQPFSGVVQTKDLIDFLNNISSAISKGESIELDGVSEKINSLANDTGVKVDTSSLRSKASLIQDLGLKRFDDMNSRITQGVTLKSLGNVTSHLTFSDRLVTGKVGDKDYLGGILFAAATNRVWASFTKTRVSQIINGMVKNKDGYRYLMPSLLTDASHMSNKDMSNTAIKLVEDAIANNEISPSEANERIKKALKRKGLEDFFKIYSDTIGDNELNSNLVISAIDNAIIKSKSTFDDRNDFLESLLGKADIDISKRFGTLPSYTVLANGLADPITNGHDFGDILLVIRTKGDLVAVQPKEGDPDYHPSYPWVIRAVDSKGNIVDVETLIFDKSYNAVDVFPKVTNKQGQTFTYQQYVDKYGDGAKSRYLGYMGARSTMSTSVSEKIKTTAKPKAKVNAEIATEVKEMEGTFTISKAQVDAYHGSPYDFDRFTTEKIGTGEGAQAFGYGLYFTDLKSIAEDYAKNLSKINAKITLNGKEVPIIPDNPLYVVAGELINKDGDIDSVIEYAKEKIIEWNKGEKPFTPWINKYKKAIEFLTKNRNNIKVEGNKGVTYQVSLHEGKSPSEYTWLEWDKPLSDANRKKILSQFERENIEPHSFFEDDAPQIASGRQAYELLESKLKSPKEASLFLLRAGVDGVKYPAESMARNATSENARGFNYVVFDENAVTIVSKAQKVDNEVKRIVREARAQGYSEQGIKAFLMKKGFTEEEADGFMKDKEAAKKIELKEELMPGYDRMMGQVDGIIEKGLNRNSPQNQILDNVLNYIRGSKAYQDATDQQREEIEREVKKAFGEKMKSAPSATKVLGLSQNIKTITMALSKYHQQRYEDMEKAEANKEKAIKKASKELVASLKYLVRKGQVSTKQMATVLRKFAKTNVLSKSSVKEFTDYMTKVFNDAEYANKLSEANKLKKIISRASKNKSNVYDANLVKLAEQFKKIDPSMVDNIDQYIKMASELKEAIRGTTAVKGKVRFANTVKISDFNDYVNTTMESQKEKIMEQLRQQVQDLLGIDASTLSYEELIDKLNETGNVSLSKENEEAVRGAVEDMFKVYSDAINNMLSSEDIDIKESKIKLVERFMKMDLSKMKIKDAIYAVDALNNFMVNGSTAKMEKVLNEYEGQRAGELLQEKNIKADVPKIYRTKWGARNFIRYFQTVPMMIENFFKGSKSIFFEKVTGIRDLISHKSEAQRIVNVILKDYTDTFYKLKPNGQKFNTAFNNIERSMLAYVSRAKSGKEGKSFKDRKSLIEQSIENLRTGNEAQQKKADLYQQVYDKILKDSKSSEEVRDKVDPINADAFDYWVDKWAKFYDELADVSENIHNKILGKDIFYTPDKVSKLNPEEVNELGDMTGSAFHTNSGVVYKKKTGRLEESTLENKLPDGSYIDLSFDNNNASLLLDALIDIKTAGDVAKLNAFLKSDSFKKIFPNAEIREVFVKRLDTMIRNFRGKNHFQDDDSRALSRFINRTGGLSSAIALTSGFQLLKQTVSVATNTLINVGRPHIGYVFNKAKRDFINNSGEAIANRGTESQADINAIDSLVSQAAESKGEKALQFIEKANKLFLSAVLKHPDVWIAKASWFAYYEKGLKRQGINAKNINYSDHELNKEAAQYAQKMVDRQQNISDADLKGEFFSSKSTANVLMSKVLFPLASFRINAWSRMNLDLRTIANKTTSFEDRKDAIYSLMGGVAEAAVFNAIGIWATGTMYGWAMGMIRGDDDDEDKQKQKERDEKYADSILRGRLSQFTNDMLSPLPLTDWLAETSVFETVDLIQDLKGVKEDERLNIFEPPDIDEPQKMTKYWGAFGIAIERLNESKNVIKAAITGKIVEKKFGQETVRYVNPKDKEVLSTIAKLAVLNGLGLLPADINNLQKNIFREIKKQASTKTDAELIQDKASKAERRAEKNEKIDLINQAITKAPNQRVADELMKMRADAIEDLSTEKKSDEEKEALKKKRESEKASYKNLLGGYDTKDDLKRYDPELYERNFGENSDYYKAHKFEQEAEKLLDKVEQKNKDLQYNYQKPSKTKSRFFNSDGTSKKSSHFNRFSSK